MHSILEQKLYEYLRPLFAYAGYLDANIAFGYQNGAALNGNYVILNISEISEDIPPEALYVYPETNNPNLENDEEIIYRSKVTLDIDLRGDEVLAAARTVKALLYSSDAIATAARLKLGFVRFSPTQTLPTILDNAYEYRAIFSIELYYTEIETIVVGTIGQVRVIGKDEEGELLVDETISEPGFIAP